jgi:hypothetical protein
MRPLALIGLDLPCRRLEAVGGMTQEDDPEHRHAVFRRGQLGIGAELIGRFPEVRFKVCAVNGFWCIAGLLLPVCLDDDRGRSSARQRRTV